MSYSLFLNLSLYRTHVIIQFLMAKSGFSISGSSSTLKAKRNRGGARKVVRITIIIIAACKGLSKTPLAAPIPAKTKPTSPTSYPYC